MAPRLEGSTRRIPAKATIPIVALCASLGFMLGRVYPLQYFARLDGAPSSIATAMPSDNVSTSMPPQQNFEESTPTFKINEPDTAVPNLAKNLEGTIVSPLPTKEAGLPESAEESPIGKETFSAETSHVKKYEGAQKKARVAERKRDDAPKRGEPARGRQSATPSTARPKTHRDDVRENEPNKRSIFSQLPIVGPVIELMTP